MRKPRPLAVLLCVALISACGGEDQAPAPDETAILLTKQGWPTPSGPTAHVYRTTFQAVASFPDIAGVSAPGHVRGSYVITQSETFTPGGDGRGTIDLVRGWSTGRIFLTRRGRTMEGRTEDFMATPGGGAERAGVGRWFLPGGWASSVAWSAANGSGGTLVFSRLVRPPEAPAVGLSWGHGAPFLPELVSQVPATTTSTIAGVDDETIEITSTLDAKEGFGTAGTRTVFLSRADGHVVRGTLEGTVACVVENAPAMRIEYKVTGKIELVDPVEVPPEIAEVDAALRQMTAADPAVRRAAAEKLGSLFPYGGRGAPVLAAALDDESAPVRRAARTALEALGMRAGEPLAAFLKGPTDPEWSGYMRIVEVVKSLGEKIKPRDVAAGTTVAPRGGSLAVAVLLNPPGKPAPWRRWDDLNDMLMDLSTPRIRGGVPLRDPDNWAFCSACLALHQLRRLRPSASRIAAPHLLALTAKTDLKHPLIKNIDRELAWSALRILDVQGSRDPAAVRAATKAFRTYGAPLAGGQFQRILGTAVSATDAKARAKDLLEGLDPQTISPGAVHTDQRLQRAVRELGRLGVAAAEAVPTLEQLLDGSHQEGKRPQRFTIECAVALMKIDGPTPKRVGFLTVSLVPPKDPQSPAWETFHDNLMIVAPSLADVVDGLPSDAMKRQAAEGAAGALRSAKLHAGALAYVIAAAGTGARHLAPDVLQMLEDAEMHWEVILASKTRSGLPGERSHLMVRNGARFSDTLTRRIVFVRTLARTGVGDDTKARAVQVLTAYADGDEPVLAYEAARALRLIK